MPAQVEDSPQRPSTASALAAPTLPPRARDDGPERHRRPVAEAVGAQPPPDRWRWRRRLRAHPRIRPIYRFLIGLAGLLLIVAGVVTGPLPGPGGIPLVLLGLAVWASEFSWARRLMQRFKGWLRRFRRLGRSRQAALVAALVAVLVVTGWLGLVVAGVPGWVPQPVAGWLAALPAV